MVFEILSELYLGQFVFTGRPLHRNDQTESDVRC
jgi:hypothetical protein